MHGVATFFYIASIAGKRKEKFMHGIHRSSRFLFILISFGVSRKEPSDPAVFLFPPSCVQSMRPSSFFHSRSSFVSGEPQRFRRPERELTSGRLSRAHVNIRESLFLYSRWTSERYEIYTTIRRMSNESKRDELKKRLTPLQWHVTQEKGTERPFSGCYNKFYERGTYTCIVCDQELFSSETKYDSGCGWPAFNEVLEQGRVKLTKDTSNDMVRTEVTCSSCGAHLGHVFNDGPKPTRKRFCINSASISFHEAGDAKKSSS